MTWGGGSACRAPAFRPSRAAAAHHAPNVSARYLARGAGLHAWAALLWAPRPNAVPVSTKGRSVPWRAVVDAATMICGAVVNRSTVLVCVTCARNSSAGHPCEACDAQGRLALPAGLGHGLLIHVCADRRRDVFTPRSESLAGSVSRTFCAFICESW